MLERVDHFLDVDLAGVLARGQLVHLEGAHDRRVDGELIHVDLGEDGVEVHHGAVVRDVEGEDAVDLGIAVPEDVLGHDVDGGSLGALGDTDGQGVLVDVEHVATLGVVSGVTTEVQGDVLVVRVILEDVLAVQGLAVAGDGVHTVQADAVADDRERVTGEVQVGHRVDDEIGLGLGVDQGVKRGGAHERHLDLGLGETGHRLLDELEVILDGIELLADDPGHLLALDAGLGDVLIQELLACIGVQVEDLGNELLKIENLDTLVAQDLGKGVVLLLSNLEERNVVKEQALQLERRQIQKLLAGPVQADLFELSDFARDMQAFRHCLLPFFSGTACAIPVQAPRGAPFNSYRYIQISERDTRERQTDDIEE